MVPGHHSVFFSIFAFIGELYEKNEPGCSQILMNNFTKNMHECYFNPSKCTKMNYFGNKRL